MAADEEHRIGPLAQPARAKLAALAVLASITLAMPVIESAVTGRIESYSPYDIAGSFLALLPIYWWYHVDKEERGYRAGPLMNVGVVAAAIVALPVYFIRSRGWRQGIKTSATAAAILGGLYLVEWLGEALGNALFSRGIG